jgi:formylglycine-generating enzyme required for sulfatase activity
VPVSQINWYEAIAFANARSQAEGLEPCYRTGEEIGIPGAGCGSGFGCGPGLPSLDWDRAGFSYASVEFVGIDCLGYRLPTEAEWEVAATLAFDAGASASTFAWTDANTQEGPMPVGRLAPDRLGMFDLFGNVWEMTSERTPEGDTVDRGGSYVDGVASMRPTRRITGSPDGRNANSGFRLVRTAPR